MRWFVLFALVICLSGCVTPSTLLVNDDGRVMRCASYGSGAYGIATATSIHSTCVNDMKKLGYVVLPDVTMGLSLEPGTTQVKTVVPGAGAAQAGIHVGDQIARMNTIAVTRSAEVLHILQDKKSGERIDVTLVREGKESTIPVQLTTRGQ